MLGPGVIEDTLAGVPIQMGVHEFYQVNTPAAELLYAKAKEFARLQPDDFCWTFTAVWAPLAFR